MKKRISLAVLCVAMALLVTTCCPDNPTVNTAITAHGNTDWHIDTAEEFLFGTDMAGGTTAANHCPDSWTKRHMHVGLSNTADFYYDSDLSTSGNDSDPTNGIDRAMLFFYAGHGSPESWSTLGNHATQEYMSLGDCPGKGLLRYYWQCSCKVFAHGPANCANSTIVYSCPGDFDGSADSYSMRNVYERWGPVLEPELRMACGASTSAFCHESQTNRIWDNYNNKSYDVADSFIDGLHGSTWVVPLCITKGGEDVTKTPLYDPTFTNQPNTSGTSHYHIQYLEHFASTPIWPQLVVRLPEMLPVYKIKPMPLPEPLRDVKFEKKDHLMLSPDEVAERGPRVKVDLLSGAVYVLGERKPAVEKPALTEQEYIDRALVIVEEQGWTEEEFAEPMGVRYLLATMPVEGEREEVQKFQKNVILTLKRQIDVEGLLVDVLGEGGTMTVQMNNDGTALNASKIWREIVGIKEEARVKTYEEAYGEAAEQLEDPKAYVLDRWTWGYKEAAGNVEQDELRVVFRFWFTPADSEAEAEYAPRMIEVPGQY